MSFIDARVPQQGDYHVFGEDLPDPVVEAAKEEAKSRPPSTLSEAMFLLRVMQLQQRGLLEIYEPEAVEAVINEAKQRVQRLILAAANFDPTAAREEVQQYEEDYEAYQRALAERKECPPEEASTGCPVEDSGESIAYLQEDIDAYASLKKKGIPKLGPVGLMIGATALDLHESEVAREGDAAAAAERTMCSLIRGVVMSDLALSHVEPPQQEAAPATIAAYAGAA